MSIETVKTHNMPLTIRQTILLQSTCLKVRVLELGIRVGDIT